MMETENNFITFIYIKYIVYCTTNLVNNKIYIGVHKTNPDVFDGYMHRSIEPRWTAWYLRAMWVQQQPHAYWITDHRKAA